MIGHAGVRVKDHGIQGKRRLKLAEEALVVLIPEEDPLPTVATDGHMILRAGKSNSPRSWHTRYFAPLTSMRQHQDFLLSRSDPSVP